jgi:hypothetical protein
MMTDKIYIGIDDKRVEAKGEVLEQILADRAKAEQETRLLEAAELERQKAKESGMLKLKSLGLTDSEIAVLLGN